MKVTDILKGPQFLSTSLLSTQSLRVSQKASITKLYKPDGFLTGYLSTTKPILHSKYGQVDTFVCAAGRARKDAIPILAIIIIAFKTCTNPLNTLFAANSLPLPSLPLPS